MNRRRQVLLGAVVDAHKVAGHPCTFKRSNAVIGRVVAFEKLLLTARFARKLVIAHQGRKVVREGRQARIAHAREHRLSTCPHVKDIGILVELAVGRQQLKLYLVHGTILDGMRGVVHGPVSTNR